MSSTPRQALFLRVLLMVQPFEANRICLRMPGAESKSPDEPLSHTDFAGVRFVAFHQRSVLLTMKDGTERVFEFADKAAMDAEIERWFKSKRWLKSKRSFKSISGEGP